MVLTIHYPANAEENFAKGTAESGIYFEVPAVFAEDGACDEPATLEKVEQYLIFLQSMRP
jgi:hypothetical protein